MLHVAHPPPSFFKIGFLDSLLSTLHLDSARLYNQLHSLSLNLNNFLILNSFFFEKFLFSTVSIIVRSLQYVYQFTSMSISYYPNVTSDFTKNGWHVSWSRTCLSHAQMSQIVLLKIVLFNIYFLEVFPQRYANVHICKSGRY